MNWNMFGPQQQGLRYGRPQGFQSADWFSQNPMARSGINMPSPDNYRVPMPQQASLGLQMPNSMSMGPTAYQQGLQAPPGLAAEMNAPLQPNINPAGINPMAMMQLLNMGVGMTQKANEQQQQPLPQAYRAPMPEVSPYSNFSLRRFGPYKMFGSLFDRRRKERDELINGIM